MIIPNLNEETHEYTVDGRVVDGVTRCLEEFKKITTPYGDEFYVDRFTGDVIKADVFEKAGQFGTAIHKAAAILVHDGKIDYRSLHPDLVPSVIALESWMSELTVVELAEQPLYSKRYDYAGTLDIFGRLAAFPKGYDLLDIKTGKYALADPQTAAYENLVRENGKVRGVVRRWVLVVPKDGTPCELVRMERRDSFRYFLNALAMKRWRDGT